MHNFQRGVAVVVLAGFALTGLAACASPSDSTPQESSNTQVIGPIVADLTTIGGTTIDATVGRTIDLTGDDETFDQWSATMSTPNVVTFTPGTTDGGASLNPGLTIDAAGTTKVTLNNAKTGETVSFTVNATD